MSKKAWKHLLKFSNNKKPFAIVGGGTQTFGQLHCMFQTMSKTPQLNL